MIQNKILILVVLFLGAAQCFSGESISMKILPPSKRHRHNEIRVKTGGIEVRRISRYRSIVFITPAGKFHIAADFPPYPMKADMNLEGLLVLDDGKESKTFEHSFLCSFNGIKMEWTSVFKVQAGIPAVLVESRLINQTDEKTPCYQMWFTSCMKKKYFSASGEYLVSKGSLIPLRASGGWVFFPINDKGGIGMLLDESLKGMATYSFIGKKGKVSWGVRSTGQTKAVYDRDQETFLKFFFFYAKSQEDAKKLCDKLKKQL